MTELDLLDEILTGMLGEHPVMEGVVEVEGLFCRKRAGPTGVGHQAGGHEGTRRQTGLTKKMSALHKDCLKREVNGNNINSFVSGDISVSGI
jgi:hypothetical protein